MTVTNPSLHLHPSLSPQSGTPGHPLPAVGNPCGDAPDIAARVSRSAAGRGLRGSPRIVAVRRPAALAADRETVTGQVGRLSPKPSGAPHTLHPSLPGTVSASAGAVLGGAGALLRHSARLHRGPLWSTPSDVLASPGRLGGETNLKPAKTTTQGHARRPWGTGVAISGDVRTLALVCVSPPMATVGQTPVRLAGRVVKTLPTYPLGAAPRGQA
jgi:hypothetical protein